MEITVNRELLFSKLQIAARVAATKWSAQGIATVSVQVDEQGFRLEADDGDMGVLLRVPAEVTETGSAALPARIFSDIVRSLSGDEVSIKNSDGVVTIKSGRANFTLRSVSSTQTLTIEEVSGTQVVVPAKDLIASALSVAKAASRDDSRPVLKGVFTAIKGNTIELVATDSYRLSVERFTIPTSLPDDVALNIPARSYQELAKLVESSTESATITLNFDQQTLSFTVGDSVLISRLIDGHFPDYNQLLPDSYEYQLNLDREALLAVVSRVGLMAQKNTPLKFALKSGELTISAQTPDIGEASESISIDYQGEEVEIGFNAAFLREGIDSVRGDEIEVKLISPIRPGLIGPVGSEGTIYLIMPIRLNA